MFAVMKPHSLSVCETTGYRSVPLKNSYNEDLELAALLVHMDIIRGRVRCCRVLRSLDIPPQTSEWAVLLQKNSQGWFE